jgi:hypothetical protein
MLKASMLEKMLRQLAAEALEKPSAQQPRGMQHIPKQWSLQKTVLEKPSAKVRNLHPF